MNNLSDLKVIAQIGVYILPKNEFFLNHNWLGLSLLKKMEKVSGYFDSDFEMDLKKNSYTNNEVFCLLRSIFLYLQGYLF